MRNGVGSWEARSDPGGAPDQTLLVSFEAMFSPRRMQFLNLTANECLNMLQIAVKGHPP